MTRGARSGPRRCVLGASPALGRSTVGMAPSRQWSEFIVTTAVRAANGGVRAGDVFGIIGLRRGRTVTWGELLREAGRPKISLVVFGPGSSPLRGQRGVDHGPPFPNKRLGGVRDLRLLASVWLQIGYERPLHRPPTVAG